MSHPGITKCPFSSLSLFVLVLCLLRVLPSQLYVITKAAATVSGLRCQRSADVADGSDHFKDARRSIL